MVWLVAAAISAACVVIGSQVSADTLAGPAEGLCDKTATSASVRGIFKTIASERATLLIAGSCLFFGFGDGIGGSGFWPQMNKLGLSSIVSAGIVQALMSCARLLGVQVWSKFIDRFDARTLLIYSLIASGVLFGFFGAFDSLAVSLLFWLARIAVLSIYFSALEKLILGLAIAKEKGATLISAASTITAIGAIVGSGILSLTSTYIPGHMGFAFVVGGVCTIVAGGLLGKYEI